MNGLLKYLIPVAFLALAGFNFYSEKWIEGWLYISVGAAFPIMWALKEGKIKSNLQFWNAFSWALVIVALLLFIAVLRTDTP